DKLVTGVQTCALPISHARYANGVLFDINEEPEKAAEEFYKAALTDPADEDLVLEASQRLLQFKEPEKAQEVLLKATKQKEAPGRSEERRVGKESKRRW